MPGATGNMETGSSPTVAIPPHTRSTSAVHTSSASPTEIFVETLHKEKSPQSSQGRPRQHQETVVGAEEGEVAEAGSQAEEAEVTRPAPLQCLEIFASTKHSR